MLERVNPLVRGCIALAVLAALAAGVHSELEPVQVKPQAGTGTVSLPATLPRPCPPGTLLDRQVCIPVPGPEPAASAASVRNWQIYDRLPRRPERPADYQRYRLPLAQPALIEPSPLGLEGQVQGDALLLRAAAREPVLHQPLSGQQGKARVLYTGDLVGKTAVVEHPVLEAHQQHTYLVIYANLAELTTRAGMELEPKARIGTLGATPSGGSFGLHLEVRRVRHGVDAKSLGPDDFRDRAMTIACDLRNVFPLKR